MSADCPRTMTVVPSQPWCTGDSELSSATSRVARIGETLHVTVTVAAGHAALVNLAISVVGTVVDVETSEARLGYRLRKAAGKNTLFVIIVRKNLLTADTSYFLPSRFCPIKEQFRRAET